MNRQLLDILYERPDFPVAMADRPILDFFCEYLDHGSLWLLGFEGGDDPLFTFTNDAQHYHFTMSQIREYYRQMKSGTPMDWERIPFDYIQGRD